MGMKKQRIYIIGTQKMADMIFDIATRSGYFVAGFFDDVSKEKMHLGKPIFGPVAASLTKKFMSQAAFIIAVGDNKGRAKLIKILKKAGAEIANIIDKTAVIMPSSRVGRGNIFFPHSFVGSQCQMGDGNICFPGVVITHHDRIGDYNFLAPGVTIGGDTIIGSHTKIGMNSVIAPHIRVPDAYTCPPLTLKKK